MTGMQIKETEMTDVMQIARLASKTWGSGEAICSKRPVRESANAMMGFTQFR
jgi:hypothetical protein